MMATNYLALEMDSKKYVELFSVKDRLDIRLPKFQKELFERIATIQGVSLTDFIIKSALDAAVEEIDKVEKLTFSMEGQRDFIENLDQPREFSESIKERYAKYSKLTVKGLKSEPRRSESGERATG